MERERKTRSHNISIGCINYYSYSTVSSFYIIIYIYYIWSKKARKIHKEQVKTENAIKPFNLILLLLLLLLKYK